MTTPRGALLTGSVNFDDAEKTMRTVAEILGAHVARIPDGEVGKRFHWIMFQPDVLGEAHGIERVGEEPIPFGAGLDARPLRIADGVEVAGIELPPLGYADAARESYALFTRLREEGAIPAGTRFQVSLPTPVAVISSFFTGDDRIAIEPVYADALLGELEQILEHVPHEDLAIQWDVASEMGILEGAAGYGARMEGWWTGGVLEGIVARLAALVDAVPPEVEVGIHLCYGDAGEKHFVEPADTANLVRVANAVLDATGRELSWLHLPVPISRDDEAYVAPLAELADGPER
jgi:hypothetical protein